jgi:hypothetical protein
MNKFENTFKVHLNTLLNSSKNYCFRNSNKQNELTKQVGDRIEFAYSKGYLMSYCMGVAENCKAIIFNQKKIEELKKLGDKKMHTEYHKIQTKLSSDSIKIIKSIDKFNYLCYSYSIIKKFADEQIIRQRLLLNLINT